MVLERSGLRWGPLTRDAAPPILSSSPVFPSLDLGLNAYTYYVSDSWLKRSLRAAKAPGGPCMCAASDCYTTTSVGDTMQAGSVLLGYFALRPTGMHKGSRSDLIQAAGPYSKSRGSSVRRCLKVS